MFLQSPVPASCCSPGALKTVTSGRSQRFYSIGAFSRDITITGAALVGSRDPSCFTEIRVRRLAKRINSCCILHVASSSFPGSHRAIFKRSSPGTVFDPILLVRVSLVLCARPSGIYAWNWHRGLSFSGIHRGHTQFIALD